MTTGFASLTDSIDVTLSVPWHSYRIEGETETGLGDATIVGTWKLTDVSLLGGFRVPTGDADLGRFAGTPGKIVPLGFGTVDLLLGVTHSRPLSEEWRLLGAALVSIPLGDYDEVPPPGVELATQPALTISGRVGVQGAPFRIALDLQWKDAEEFDDGGAFAWITPGATWGPLDVDVQVPLKGGHFVATIGLNVRF